MYTALLVDDMPAALKMLQKDLESYKEIEVIGTANGVVEAAKLLQKYTPDFLFLDIMLGDGTGFDILEIVPNLASKIIFVTASDAHAIRAFKFAAIDYLLKPYSLDSLDEAIKKAKAQIIPDAERLSILKTYVDSADSKPKRISLHTLDQISVINIDDIIRCQSDNNYTHFYLVNDTKILVTKTLKYYADMLQDSGFLRVHQRHLVNLNFVKAFIKSDGGYLQLQNKDTVPVSVRKRAEVVDALSSLK